LSPSPIREYGIGAITLGMTEGEPAALSCGPRFEHTHIIGMTGGGNPDRANGLTKQNRPGADIRGSAANLSGQTIFTVLPLHEVPFLDRLATSRCARRLGTP
jgi:hypothetical protein